MHRRPMAILVTPTVAARYQGKLRFNVPPDKAAAPRSADPGGTLSMIQFVAMISGEARKGPLVFART